MGCRSLAIATSVCILAACGPSDRIDGADPAAAPLATSATAVPLVASPPDPAASTPDVAALEPASTAPDPSATAVDSAPPATSPRPTPTPTPTPAPALLELVSTVTSKAHNSLVLQHFTCNIQVTNGSSVPRTGKVTVTFVHDAAPEDGSPQASQEVSLPAGGTANLTFTDPKFHPLSEDVLVRTATDPYVPTATPAPLVSFKEAVAPLISLRCAGCHAPGGKGSSQVALFTAAGTVSYANVSKAIVKVVNEVQAGNMPEGRPMLTPAEMATLEKWEAAGTPEN